MPYYVRIAVALGGLFAMTSCGADVEPLPDSVTFVELGCDRFERGEVTRGEAIDAIDNITAAFESGQLPDEFDQDQIDWVADQLAKCTS